MQKGVAVFFILLIVIPLAHSLSLKELISKYVFYTITPQMDVTSHSDFMVDKNGNDINDTLVFELTTSNANGAFIFVIDLFDKKDILVNETNKTLSAGTNKVNITFNSIFLTQSQFNYSIKIYNSTYNLKYRKDSIQTRNYPYYEKGFRVLSISDFKSDKTLKINISINSSINGAFETTVFLNYNNSIIFRKENKSIINSTQSLILDFDGETIKKTHYIGNFTVSSVKIDKKSISINSSTQYYDFKDFANASFVTDFDDRGIDLNHNGKYEILEIIANAKILRSGTYTFLVALYDFFDKLIEIENSSYYLNAGENTAVFSINGSQIHDKKLNGPFVVKYIKLFEQDGIIDEIGNAYTTSNYNFNDFESPDLPDLQVNITVSDGYRYGIGNITINFTFKNAGKKHAFNIFTDIFDNNTYSKANKSNILMADSQISYQINFTNISDFEITAIADLNDIVEELNESNNAEKVAIKLNKKPVLKSVDDMYVNETDKIIVKLSASDPNNDELSFSINWSKFSANSSIFQWSTTTTESGNYTLNAVASDGFLADSKIFKIIILDAPEKDVDNDGIEDNVDKLIGSEDSVNTSTINLTIFLGGSRNLSKHFNESTRVRLMDGNFTVAEFDFDFSLYKLNLTNLTMNKQTGDAAGSLVVLGLKMPEGVTKSVYVDKTNPAFNGVCIKEEEISSISQISSNCDSNNEFPVECDGSLQNSYICTYNSTFNKYRIQGLKHSGVVQIPYTKLTPESGTSASAVSAAGGSGGSGGVVCISNWRCSEWSECLEGFKRRKCSDSNQCAFPGKKPAEAQQCDIYDSKKLSSKKGNIVKAVIPMHFGKEIKEISNGLASITGKSIDKVSNKKSSYVVITFIGVIFLLVGYFVFNNIYKMP